MPHPVRYRARRVHGPWPQYAVGSANSADVRLRSVAGSTVWPHRGCAGMLGSFPLSEPRYPCCKQGSPRRRTSHSDHCQRNRYLLVLQHLSNQKQIPGSRPSPFVIEKAGDPGAHYRTGATGPQEITTISILLGNCGIGPILTMTGDPTVTASFLVTAGYCTQSVLRSCWYCWTISETVVLPRFRAHPSLLLTSRVVRHLPCHCAQFVCTPESLARPMVNVYRARCRF